MADGRDELPDTVTLASDIQRAVSAYRELQTQLTVAIKPWQESWVAMAGAVSPIQEQVDKAAIEWSAVRERWQTQLTAMQGALVHGAEIWAASQLILAKELCDFGPRLRRTLEGVDHVGRLGWTVTWNMTPPDMASLSDMRLPSEADAYMLAWYEEVDADLNRLEGRLLDVTELEPFRTPLSQCFTAYRRGEYAIAIPFLAAVLERGIRHLGPTEHFFSTKVEKTVKDRYDTAKEDSPHTIRVYFWMSLYAFVQWFYEQYGPTVSGEDRIFRHGIQHGTQPPPNEKIEVLRLLHALNTITGLYPKLPVG